MLKRKVSNRTLAKRHGKLWALRLFEDFNNNPEYQGPNFHWNDSMDSFAKLCSSNLFMIFEKSPRNMNELKCIAKKSFSKQWKKLIHDSNR